MTQHFRLPALEAFQYFRCTSTIDEDCSMKELNAEDPSHYQFSASAAHHSLELYLVMKSSVYCIYEVGSEYGKDFEQTATVSLSKV